MYRHDKINKLFDINNNLAFVIITIHILQITLINSLFSIIGWLVVLLLYIVRMIINNKIDKLRTEIFNEWFESMFNKKSAE